MAGENLTIWDKVVPAVPNETANGREAKEAKVPRSRTAKAVLSIFDVWCAAIWCYALGRLFVGDIDRWFVERIAPERAWVLDFRFFLILVLMSGFVVLIRRRYIWIPLYLMFFPFIVILWKVPRFLYKRKSWLLLIGTVHIVVSSVRSIRFAVISITVAAFALLGIVASDNRTVLRGAIIAMLTLWAVSLYKAFRYALSPARFVQSQRGFVARLLASKWLWSWVSVDEKARDPAVVRMTPEESNQFLMKAGSGLIAYRASQFWAYKLDVYRRSGASIVFSALSLVGLLIQAVVTFMLVNHALFKLDPSQFETANGHGLPLFAYYSFASLFANEISAISPRGNWAAWIQIVAGFSTAVVVLILIATLFFGIRQTKVDVSANEAIREMRRRGDEFAERLSVEFQVSLDDLIQRMAEFGWDLLGILAYLTREIPEPPIEDEAIGAGS